MASLAAFFEAPSVAFLKTCKKDELSRIADHFCITVPERVHKDELRDVIVSSLFDQGVLQQREKEVSEEHLSRKASLKVASQVAELTFEQQKELLSMQLEQEKLRRQEMFELEKLRQNTEKMRLELEHSRLQLMREGPEVQDAGLDEDDETPGVPRIYGGLENSDCLQGLGNLSEHLDEAQKGHLKSFTENPVVWDDSLTQTDLIGHHIDVNDSPPSKHCFYSCAVYLGCSPIGDGQVTHFGCGVAYVMLLCSLKQGCRLMRWAHSSVLQLGVLFLPLPMLLFWSQHRRCQSHAVVVVTNLNDKILI
ncbi:uncharacterized protein V6R79_018685 [Siganus canaliculatus]